MSPKLSPHKTKYNTVNNIGHTSLLRCNNPCHKRGGELVPWYLGQS